MTEGYSISYYVDTMFIHRNTKRVGDKVYRSTLLMESYREGKKVKHRTLTNLSRWKPEQVVMLDAVLKGELLPAGEVALGPGRGYGALFAVCEIARELGIAEALGEGKEARHTLLMMAARIAIQSSKLACSRWSYGQATEEILGIDPPTEDDLYSAMDWALLHQARIEDEIFAHRHKGSGRDEPTLFLYDVTSSYLEGECNELAAYGYNRDRKKGKKQVVVGLLADQEGFPVSCQVFPGNTQDIATLPPQIDKVARRFGAGKVALVGDKGMIKSTSLEAIKKHGFSYITSITKPEIETLAQAGIIQLSLFDTELCEVEDSGVRYILRRNPQRAEEVSANRGERLAKALSELASERQALSTSKRKNPRKAYDRMVILLDKLRLSKFVKLSLEGRDLSFAVDEEALSRACALDGCYCIKTDLARKDMDASEVHDRYRDLALVEQAFRDLKTGFLEIRPLNHRKGSRTRSHALICMLALMVTHEMRRRLEGSDIPLEHVIRVLDRIQIATISIGATSLERVNSPDEEQEKILGCFSLKIPPVASRGTVGTKTKRKIS